MTRLPLGRSVRVRVPATSANLGPGFDTLGLALSLYDELDVRVRPEPGAHVVVQGSGSGEVPIDDENLVVRALRRGLESAGVDQCGLELEARNAIPHGRGMGSSAAAIVAGLMAARGLVDGVADLSAAAMLRIATDMEGHPDNVAPALFGGLTIAWTTDSGPASKRLLVHRGVSPVVFVPDATLSTKLARSLQPVHVPHEDAAFNVSRSALLVAALVQSPELLLAATEDRLHQSYRASAMPETDALIRVLREHGLAAVVSGAGPSILVLGSDPAQRLQAAELVERHASSRWSALMLAVDLRGATVVAHPTSRTDPPLVVPSQVVPNPTGAA
ncbi:homoserine kinase [Curtobacterium ammoniigenes]|uniref:homoserine kinase n=1 Tax=Curtobacterium ammoniigenes TaxID=395387 RepID=UPI00082B9669|nr:homoserine kinase [Curtobacterium ammoniigenes]